MNFSHSVEQALAENIGPGGISASAYKTALADIEPALVRLRGEAWDASLALLGLPGQTMDIAGIEEIALKINLSGATNVVILGTGGSSLGGQALAQLAWHAVSGVSAFNAAPRLHFMDNLDPATFDELLKRLPLPTTHFIAISKSGSTGETLMQTMAALQAVREAGLESQISTHFFGISETLLPGKTNALRSLLEPFNVQFLPHDPGVGGRFSVLTNVGLLPAALIGLNIRAIRAGAADLLQTVVKANDNPIAPVIGAALNLAAMREGKNISVMMAYGDRFERLTRWWVQLWAESIGKDGKGSQPVGALGPVDQHSQQQLYLAGPSDRLFTIITQDSQGLGPKMPQDLAEQCSEAGFAGRTMGDLVAAQGLAMIDTFVRNGRPVRQIHLERLGERSLGSLLMHFMLETILTGYALDVDPFDQPAVEEAKILAKAYLAEGKGA